MCPEYQCRSRWGKLKVKHTEDTAMRALVKERDTDLEYEMHVYVCEKCGWLHIGHHRKYQSTEFYFGFNVAI